MLSTRWDWINFVGDASMQSPEVNRILHDNTTRWDACVDAALKFCQGEAVSKGLEQENVLRQGRE